MKNPYKYIIVVLAFGLTLPVSAQFSDKKNMKKSAAFDKNGRVSVSNRHGNVDVMSWTKDSIRVEVEISVKSKSLDRMQEMLANTQPIIRLTPQHAEITTQIDQSPVGKGVNSIRELAGDNVLMVNYKVYVPRNCKLLISNKFGNVFLEDHYGDVNIDIGHGNVRGNEIPNLESLNCNFADVFVNTIDALTLNAKFSELEFGSVNRLSMTGKSTTLNIEELGTATINSTNDKIKFDKVDEFILNGTLSKVRIVDLHESSTVTLKYGSVRISEIKKGACNLTFNCTRTTIDLAGNKDASFKVTGFLLDGDFQTSGMASNIKVEGSTLSGHYGNDANSSCKLTFSGQKNKVFIR